MHALVLASLLATSSSACSQPACEGHDWKAALPPVALAAVHRVDEKKVEPPAPERPRVDDPKHQADLDADYELGKQYAAEVDKELKKSENAEMIARVERIGNELAAIANRHQVEVLWGDPRLNPFPYSFRVVKGDDVNAFSIPGGFIYIYEGLVKYAESDDELAGVVAHEIAHAAFRHIWALRREQSRLSAITLPLILISIFSRSEAAQGVATAGNLVATAIGSGWSQQAETSADHGGVLYMLRSRYNPVGALTFIERLAYDERMKARVDWGIYRTHPPTRERARAITALLTANNVPIRRSQVTTTLRSVVKPGENGTVVVSFAGIVIHTFAGDDAIARADEAAVRLNSFFDSEPKLFDLSRRGESMVGRNRTLFSVTDADLRPGSSAVDVIADQSELALRKAVYELAYRTWDAF